MQIRVNKIGSLDLSRKIRELAKANEKIAYELALEAKKHYEEGFKNSGGQTDSSATGWKRLSNGKKSYLTNTGRLRRSLKVIKQRGSCIVRTTVPYAKYNNDARYGKQREFIGRSRKLERKILSMIRKKYSKILK